MEQIQDPRITELQIYGTGGRPAAVDPDAPTYDRDVIECLRELQRKIVELVLDEKWMFADAEGMAACVAERLIEDANVWKHVSPYEDERYKTGLENKVRAASIISDVKWAANVPAYIMPITDHEQGIVA